MDKSRSDRSQAEERASGSPCFWGSSQARALTATTTLGEERAGGPPRGRSCNSERRCSKNRLRHLLTICRGMDKPMEIPPCFQLPNN
jgi:hypothetical protein